MPYLTRGRLFARPRRRALLGVAIAALLLTRDARTALHLGRRQGLGNLSGGRGLAGHDGLRLVLFFFDNRRLFRLRRRGWRMELGAQEHNEALILVGLYAH